MAYRPRPRRNILLVAAVFGAIIGLLLPPLASFDVAGRTMNIRVTDLLIIAGWIALLARWRFSTRYGDVHLIAVAFLVWTMATFFWSADPLRTIMYSLYLLEAYLAFIVASEYFRTTDGTRLLVLLRVFGTLLVAQVGWAVWLAYQKVGLNPFAWKQYLIIPMGGSNYIAPFLEFIAIYELALGAAWWPVFSGMMLFALVATLSRGGMFSFGFGLALWVAMIVVQRQPALGWKRATGLLLTLGTISYGLWLVRTPLEEWFGIIGHSLGQRAALASDALEAFVESPFTGVGFAAFGSWAGTNVRAPHNLWMQLLSETGIIGTWLFLVLMLVIGVRLLRAYVRGRTSGESKEVLAISIGLAVLLVHSMVEPFFLDGTSGVWIASIVAWFLSVPHAQERSVVKSATQAQA